MPYFLHTGPYLESHSCLGSYTSAESVLLGVGRCAGFFGFALAVLEHGGGVPVCVFTIL